MFNGSTVENRYLHLALCNMTYVSPVMIAEAFFSRFEGILDTHIKVLIKTQLHIQTPYLIKFNLTTVNLNFAFIVQDNVGSSEEIWAPAKS